MHSSRGDRITARRVAAVRLICKSVLMPPASEPDALTELTWLVGDFRRSLAELARQGASAVSAAPLPIAAPEPNVADPELVATRRTLSMVRDELGDCQRCKLSATRNQIVFGVGSESARLMFIGEAPGAEEDRRGEPFVGPAGHLLDKMINAMGWSRETVYIANVLKCLRYNAQVQLGDGSWERIGRLVRSRYAGTVMSVDAAGNLVRRRVTGWHATPLGDRSVYRLTYRSAKRSGRDRVAIQLTGDHPVLTDRGYVPVDELPAGARIATGQGLSERARDVVYGTLLADGSINRASSHLHMAHSRHQHEYALFKADLLAELECWTTELQVAAGGEQRCPVTQVRTLAQPSLRIVRDEFYRPTKRVPESLASEINARMVAIWFLDDGYTRIRPPRHPSSEIATCGFPTADLGILVRGLQRLGIDSYVRRDRIHVGVDGTVVLSELIAPLVPGSMRYKLHPGVEARVPYDPSRWDAGPTRVLYDAVDVERIEHTGTDKTFFCIDVDDTHNFVTAGGIVHNCRPPGNRDPAPDEVAQCEPFLARQIDAIRPRLIVTLGKPAAHLVLKTRAPISALRGRFQEYRGIPVMPTFHPAYLLRSPERKADTWSDLKKVIAELRRMGIETPLPRRD